MNAAVVRRTQEALGKVIRRPPLTEKLLNKPPFRYLHDIITEVIRITGFMKGLYTDAEMKSDNVKDKDAKIGFLQKAIDVVIMVSGEPLSAKPARIVAGHEPERTNELLQLIGKCCVNKLSSEDAVKRVLSGEKGDAKGKSSLMPKSQELDNKNAKEEKSRIHRDREDRRNSEIKERSASRDQKQKEELKEESKPREKERDKEKEKTKENDRDRYKDSERDKHREGEREKSKVRAKQEREREKDSEREKERERKHEGGKGKEKLRDRDREHDHDKGRDREKDKQRGKNREHSRDRDRDKSRERERFERKSTGSGEVSKKLSDGSFKDSKAETETEVSTKASRSLTTKASKRRSKNSVEGKRDSRTSENSLSLERDHNSSYTKAKKEHTMKQLGRKEDNVSAKILDPIVSGLNNEPDQESTTSEIGAKEANTHSASVSDENSTGLWRETLEADPMVRQKGDSTSDGGGLVKKILETKKDYEKLQQSPKSGEKERLLVFESAWKKEKDIVSKEIEKLRVSIQTLCKSALPLGKIMDYIQEDVDAMQNELQLWHRENKQHAEALQKEQSITDCAVEPLKAELAELEQLIKEQQDKICAVKANILKNEEKIQKMVYSINLSSRR
ncbi:TRAF3-interacting protein 1 isoform X8 [Tamandua tetradactyla]|uniref:TRAF3-interacting protein 1 isoform X8 n=1 Tax=Tamandua tetradactyla TaxID=48850 RepID=UPI004053A76A